MSNLSVKFLDDDLIRVDGCRIKYGRLFKPWIGRVAVGDDGKPKTPKYSAKFLLPLSGRAEIAKLKQHLDKMVIAEFKAALPSDRMCLRSGKETGDPDAVDCWVLSASEANPPIVLGRGNKPLTEADGVVYDGCVVSVTIRPWKQNNSYGKRLNANLLAVRFMEDAEAFKSARSVDASKIYGDFADEAEEATSLDDGLGTDL